MGSATGSGHLVADPAELKAECVYNNFGTEVRLMVQEAAQQRRLFLVQSRIPTREEIVEFQFG